MSTVPDWATELTIKVCKDYKRWPPTLEWRKRTDNHYLKRVTLENGGWTYVKAINGSSSGVTYTRTGLVRVRAGSDMEDAKLVLLHELAHHILAKSKKGKREHHSLRFWRLAFELYHRYGIDLDRAYEREKGYKVKAQWAYNELVSKLK